MRIETKTTDDFWTVASVKRFEFMRENFGEEPKFVFLGRNQYQQLREDIGKFGMVSTFVKTFPELMGAQLLVVDREDFMRFTK